MPTEYCTVCGCVVPFCKHTEVKAGPWLRVCVSKFGTNIADPLYMESIEKAIEHCKATLTLNPEYTRVQLHEGATSTTPVVWDSIEQEMAEAAMLMSGIDPDEESEKVQAALLMMGGVDHPGIKRAREKPVYRMVNPQIIPCTTLRPDHPELAGKFIAEGFMLDSDGDRHDFKTRTSMLVKIDIEAGYVETLNSIYKIV